MKTLITLKSLAILVIAIFVLTGCEKRSTVVNPDNNNGLTPGKDISQLNISSTFDYKTTNDVTVSIVTKLNANSTLTNFPISIYDGDPDNGGQFIASGASDDNGQLTLNVSIPSFVKVVYAVPMSIGLPLKIPVTVSGNTASLDYSSIPASAPVAEKKSLSTSSIQSYKTLGTWDANGVPKYLEPVNDVIDQHLLSDINTSIPEYQNVPVKHPEFITAGAQSDVNITELADVYVTFIYEGAGYRNALGFYTYPLNNPPKKVSDIDSTMTIVFPNCSLPGSGGNLNTGNKVKIGRFPANTGIGWFVVANGFNGTGPVVNSAWTVFSDPVLNPESDPNLQRHNVLLVDPYTKQTVLAFEDMRRDNASCDNDFNDVIFTVSSNPVEAISQTQMAKMYQAVDSDGDGVLDANDAYPNDPTKAYNTYYPGINTFGSVAFEDLWPAKGDYDFNDMVVDYKYDLVTNSANKVVEMDCDFVLRAIGASYSNGFGFQLNCSPSVIQSVTGTKLTTGKIGLSGNGTEAGQSKAVVVLFDNAHNLMQPMGGSYINTEPGKTYITPVTFHVVITFSTPQAPAWLGSVPFNPFIFINGDRGKEVHLPNNPPTTLVNNSYFKTVDDYSLIGSGTYYKSKNNLPWALNIPVTFDYPIEKAAITSAYPYFGVWAESNGLSSTNWYTTAAGNRITSKIFSK